MKKILLHPKLKRKIADELNLSSQSVDMSLCYTFNSENAIQVRARAKELLLEEVQKIEEDKK